MSYKNGILWILFFLIIGLIVLFGLLDSGPAQSANIDVTTTSELFTGDGDHALPEAEVNAGGVNTVNAPALIFA